MAKRNSRPGPKLTFKDLTREAWADIKRTSWLERTVVILGLILLIQVSYHLMFVPGEATLETELAEVKTEIAQANLAMTKPNKASKAEPPPPPVDVLEKLDKLDENRAGYKYDPTGKRDPFLAFDFAPRAEDDASKTPLERYDLGQLKLTAVLAGFDKPRAIVENAAGKGFTVTEGTKIGRNNGVITVIDKDKITVRERYVDFTGLEQIKDIELRLRLKGTDDQQF